MPRDLFRVHERGSSVRTEIVAGITTFTTMAYIIVVNPAILSFAGLPTGPSTVATILAAAFGCVAMGLYANRPWQCGVVRQALHGPITPMCAASYIQTHPDASLTVADTTRQPGGSGSRTTHFAGGRGGASASTTTAPLLSRDSHRTDTGPNSVGSSRFVTSAAWRCSRSQARARRRLRRAQ